jgi:hypothetical protein
MGRPLALIVCLLAVLCAVPAPARAAGPVAEAGPRWDTVTPDLQQILAPVARDWEHMPAYQRQRLLNAARQYPKLNPVEQARFQARLPDWAKLPHDTRNEARDTFRKFHSLPTDKREALKQRWHKAVEVPPESARGTTAESGTAAGAGPAAKPSSATAVAGTPAAAAAAAAPASAH